LGKDTYQKNLIITGTVLDAGITLLTKELSWWNLIKLKF